MHVDRDEAVRDGGLATTTAAINATATATAMGGDWATDPAPVAAAAAVTNAIAPAPVTAAAGATTAIAPAPATAAAAARTATATAPIPAAARASTRMDRAAAATGLSILVADAKAELSQGQRDRQARP